MDLVYIVITLALFALSVGLVYGFERLRRPQ
jgi:hypothetical protein